MQSHTPSHPPISPRCSVPTCLVSLSHEQSVRKLPRPRGLIAGAAKEAAMHHGILQIRNVDGELDAQVPTVAHLIMPWVLTNPSTPAAKPTKPSSARFRSALVDPAPTVTRRDLSPDALHISRRRAVPLAQLWNSGPHCPRRTPPTPTTPWYSSPLFPFLARPVVGPPRPTPRAHLHDALRARRAGMLANRWIRGGHRSETAEFQCLGIVSALTQ